MLADLAHAIGNHLGRDRALVATLQPLYARYLQAVCGRRGLAWHVNGEPLRIHPSMRRMLPHENEPALFAFLRDELRPGQFVIDIGAFLGTYAILEARRVGATGRVLAFEPSPETFSMLTQHLSMNGLASPQVEARCAAVGSLPGTSQLLTWPAEPYRNMIAPSTPGEAGNAAASATAAGGAPDAPAGDVRVQAVTLDGVCAAEPRLPDWIRMDVQGQEFEVLRGAREVIRATRGRLRLIIETHPEQWLEYGLRPADARERFAALGLRVRPLVPGDPLFVQSGHVIAEAA